MRHEQITETINAVPGVQGVALTDRVGILLASCGAESAAAEHWAAVAFVLWRLVERCSDMMHSGRVEHAVLHAKHGTFYIESRNETHLVVLTDESLPVENLVERIAMILDETGEINELIPRQEPRSE